MLSRRPLIGTIVIALGALCMTATAAAAEKARVLVYSGSTGYRHDSIPAAVEAMKSIGAKAGYDVDATEDPEVFTAEKLKPCKASRFAPTNHSDSGFFGSVVLLTNTMTL